MILTRTPLRVSFIGGGSDFPEFFNYRPGYSLGASIDLFVYTGVLAHSALSDSKFKISYRLNESVDAISDIQHPLVRASLISLNWENPGLHISTLADVPARTGLGSSSSFAVGLWKALNLLRDKKLTDIQAARGAITLEREILMEPGGWQDQCFSAFTGMNLFKFENNSFNIVHEFTDETFIAELNQRMILVSTGASRDSGVHAEITQKNLSTREGAEYAEKMARLAFDTGNLMKESTSVHQSIIRLAEGINCGWDLKMKLSGTVKKEVQDLIALGMNSGALAAKLCGAGGSGFIFFLLGDTTREKFIEVFPDNRVQSINIFRKDSSVYDSGIVI